MVYFVYFVLELLHRSELRFEFILEWLRWNGFKFSTDRYVFKFTVKERQSSLFHRVNLCHTFPNFRNLFPYVLLDFFLLETQCLVALILNLDLP
jgi:hypothetical protein